MLSWGYLRHTSRLAAIQKQLSAQALAAATAAATGEEAVCPGNQRDLSTIGVRANAEKPNVNAPKCGYVPLSGDGDVTSCPSQLATQVTETSDLASVSSDQERIALLMGPGVLTQQQQQRGEAEGAQSANEGAGGSVLNSGRSDSERPLLVTSSASSDDRLEEGTRTDVDDQGHSNPLMTSFTEDGDSKKLAASTVGAPSVLDAPQDSVIYTLPFRHL